MFQQKYGHNTTIMNIWASNKDISIKYLLLLLAEQFEQGSYEIVDSNLDDDRSIRLTNFSATNAQLYIFTYGQEENCYGVHIEFPDLQETNYRDTIEMHDNVSFDTLKNIIITNLEIPTGAVKPALLF